jgi:hypothetical protein
LNDLAIYEFGDVVQANAGYTDQFLLFNTIFNPGVVFKYRKSFSDKIDDSDIPNTGGEWVFIRPQLAAQITPAISLSTRIELPIYSNVEGTQLTPTWRFTAGISFKFKKNEINIIN